MHEEILSYHRLETDLKDAIARQQFELLYQPQLRLADQRVDAVEALLRWKHPERGRVSPGEFISVAEESGHIIPLGLWVIEEVCRQLKRWESAGVPLPRVAINVSAVQFRQPGFHDAVRAALRISFRRPRAHRARADGALPDGGHRQARGNACAP